MRAHCLGLIFACSCGLSDEAEEPASGEVEAAEDEQIQVSDSPLPKSVARSMQDPQWAPDPRQSLPSQPDIVLVVIDTLRADHLSLYGHERETTPNIDRLGREGIWFSRAYAQSGWTLPSFTSLFSGLLPHQHKVGRDRKNQALFGKLDPEVQTLAELLKEAGYRTGAVMNNTFLAPEFGLNQGFDSYDWQGASNDRHRSAQDTVDLGLRWLDEAEAGQPSFLVLHLMEPHADYAPRPEVRHQFTPKGPPPIPVPFTYHDGLREEPYSQSEKDYLLQLYDEEIYDADLAIGRLSSALEETGRASKTVLVMTSDHGEEFWDHGQFEHGKNLHGELTRVPLVMSGPGLSGGEVDLVVEHLDLFETLLEIGGTEATVPAGESLWTLLAQLKQDSYLDMLAQRTAVSDNTLYGPPRLSIANYGARYLLNQGTGKAEVWAVDEQGLELTQLVGDEMVERGQALQARLEARRGHLQPVAVEADRSTLMEGSEAFDQLRALGYVDP